MTYNRTKAATALLAEIKAWCLQTSTPENSIGHILFLHPGFVALLRKRLTLSEEKEQQVRAFLSQHPNGWRGALPLTHANGTRPRPLRSSKIRLERGGIQKIVPTDAQLAVRHVDRDPCPRCGVRGDIGCGHSRAPLRTAL